MDIALIKSKYRVVRVLHVEDGFAALQVVDLEDREKREYILNVYEGRSALRFVALYDSLRDCPEFRGVFPESGALAALFTLSNGENIDDVFFKGADVPWRERLAYAQQLFDVALRAADFPPEIACSAMLSRNLRVQRQSRALAVNYIVQPVPGATPRDLNLLLADQVEKVMYPRFESPPSELAFIAELRRSSKKSVATLYAMRRTAFETIINDYEKLYTGNSLQRFAKCLLWRVKEKIKNRRPQNERTT